MSTHELNQQAMGEAGGHDGRHWCSFGTVRPDTPDSRSVTFMDAQGNTLPWPTVQVELHPSGTVVSCRVSNSCAGVSEGEWYPFVAGDEVMVLIPEGDEKAGCTIIDRLNQTKDTFPLQVAGQDVTTNTFGFRRMRAPYILESAASLLLRQATTNTFISLDKTGNVTISEGTSNNFVHVGTDFVTMQTGDNKTLVQLNPTKQQVLLQAGSMQLILDATKTQLMTNGSLLIATGGMIAVPGHAVSAEQVLSLVTAMLLSLCSQLPGPLIGAAIAAQIPTIMQAAIPLTLTPPASAAQYAGPMAAMLAIPTDPTGTVTGFARASFRL